MRRNSQQEARGVYERLGYRLAGIRLGQVTTYLDASEPRDSTSRVKERTTVSWLLLKGEQKTLSTVIATH